jgi:hypothetical protein
MYLCYGHLFHGYYTSGWNELAAAVQISYVLMPIFAITIGIACGVTRAKIHRVGLLLVLNFVLCWITLHQIFVVRFKIEEFFFEYSLFVFAGSV